MLLIYADMPCHITHAAFRHADMSAAAADMRVHTYAIALPLHYYITLMSLPYALSLSCIAAYAIVYATIRLRYARQLISPRQRRFRRDFFADITPLILISFAISLPASLIISPAAAIYGALFNDSGNTPRFRHCFC